MESDRVRHQVPTHDSAHEQASLGPLDVQRTRDGICSNRCHSHRTCPAGNVVSSPAMSKKTQAFEVTNQAVRNKHEDRCANCGQESGQIAFDVHHIVPRGQGGSNLMSNQVVLCRRCHDAAHGKRMAPTVQSMSTGKMDSKTFELYRQFWHEILPAIGEMCSVPIEPIFIDEDRSWHVPEADMRMLMGLIEART